MLLMLLMSSPSSNFNIKRVQSLTVFDLRFAKW